MGMNSQRHAYLIMAHNNFDQLRTLIGLLDDVRNDIYLHIDKKVTDFCPEYYSTEHAGLFFVDPISVTWGGHSQIACELQIFKAAAPGHYLYYHVLSGLDLPIKTQDEIHAFFSEHAGQNFMELDEAALETRDFAFRTQYYHLFTNIVGKRFGRKANILRKIDSIALDLQKALHLTRKEIVPLYKGANWVSITDEMVHYILSQEKLIKKQFYYSYCADEVFLQSLAMYSPYRNTVVNNYYREIDWDRGGPYVYRKEDFQQLLASSAFFARKFDVSVDPDVICMIANHLTNQAKSNCQPDA